jgi:hypothetical protein
MMVTYPNTRRYPELADREWLYRRYVTERGGFGAIARELGCTPPAVRAALARHQIQVRGSVNGMRGVLADIPAEELVRVWKAEGSVERAAGRFGVSRTVLKRWLNQYGVDVPAGRLEHIRRNGQGKKDATRERWPAELHDRDWLLPALVGHGGYGAYSQVARELGCSAREVRAAAAEHGITVKALLELRDAAIVEAHERGELGGVIASRFGVDKGTVSRVLTAAGVPPRKRDKRSASVDRRAR